MARQRMITRTVSTTNFEVMAVKLADKTVETITLPVVSADTMTDKKLTQAITNAVPDGYQFVMVTGQNVTTEIWGMTEADFMKYAVRVER